MTTEWTIPTIISQYSDAADVHIPWDDSKGYSAIQNKNDKESLVTNGSLTHLARSPKTDLQSKTYFLKLQGFNFVNLPAVLSGIEFKLTANRSGRITDETIQLCLGDSLIGDNNADLILDPIKIYGGSTDLWNTINLSITDIQNQNFGVVLRFQSHPKFPHRDGAYINAVELRIH
jgi:hypothetical protein